MNLESLTTINNQSSALETELIHSNSVQKQNKDIQAIVRIVLLLCALTIICSFFVIINPGQRGVLMKFGEVQPGILSEGIHPIDLSEILT
ncbi:MAG: hypothetical protein NHB32_25905 [Fischerella sp. CENA71]|nr:hypothetical protein [Fischerella sp. CENA71]